MSRFFSPNRFHLYLGFVIISQLVGSPTARSDVEYHAPRHMGSEGGMAMQMPATLEIKGEITPADSITFMQEMIMRVKTPMEIPSMVFVRDSPGGSVEDALKIGSLINRLNLPVWVIADHCDSACALIVLSAKSRRFLGNIGLHRPYYEPKYFSGLSAADAEIKYRQLDNQVRSWLISNYVPTTVVDKMFATPSTSIWNIDTIEAEKLFGLYQPPFFEWLQAQCSDDLNGKWTNDTKRCVDGATFKAFMQAYQPFFNEVIDALRKVQAQEQSTSK